MKHAHLTAARDPAATARGLGRRGKITRSEISCRVGCLSPDRNPSNTLLAIALHKSRWPIETVRIASMSSVLLASFST
jgi:hypothetical protein